MKPENVKCPDCDGPMVPHQSQYGAFWGCKAYPRCKGTRNSMGLSKEDVESTHSEQDNEAYETRWDRK